MKKLEQKICAFVESLDSQDFDFDSQMTLLPAVGGGPGDLPLTNRGNCRNESQACGNTINGGDCMNVTVACAGSANYGACINNDLVDNPNTDSTKCKS